MADELPNRIHAFGRNGVSFDEFFKSVTNTTPATSAILKEAIKTLQRDGEIEIRDKDGLKKQTSIQNNEDVVTPAARPSIFRLKPEAD